MANSIVMPRADVLVAMSEKYNAWDVDQANADAEHEECIGCEGRGTASRGYILDLEHDPTPLCDECAQTWVQMFARAIPDLITRRDELLALVAKLSQTVPLESEVAEALNQRGTLLAEVGTLKARVAELEHELADPFIAAMRTAKRRRRK